jgi:gluconolactonase
LEIKLKDLKFIRINMFFVILVFFLCTNIFAQSPVPIGAKLDTVVSGLAQPEGPVWKDGLGLLFSDIARSKIYQWSPSTNSTTTYLDPSDNSNGLTFDAQGLLILTQMQLRRVSRQESNGIISPLASTYNGKKFNSPNDLVVKSDGSIFFTDPDYNTPNGQIKEMGFKGVFRISPSGTIRVLDSTTFDKPNGICFSPDESKLYVNDTPKRKIYVWKVDNDSTISDIKPFYTIPVPSGGVDGMKVDPAGNLYCTGPGGVWIVSPDGVYLDKIATPRDPSNCAWGDADKQTLYITTGNGNTGTGFVYRIGLASSTGIDNHGSVFSGTFQLYANYPNPFNPSTTIEYQTKKPGSISMKVFDVLGCEVAILVNEFKPPGMHLVQWNASGMPSGIYFYQLQAGNVVQTNKLVLLK